MFEKKYKLAKDDASDLRGALKRLEGMEFDDDIYAVEKELLLNESETLKHSNRCEKIKKRIASLRKNKEKTQKAVNSVVIDVIDIEDVLIQIKEKKKQSADLISESIQVAEDISSNREHVKKINSFVKMFDIEALHEKKELAAKKLQLLNEFVSEINSTEESYERQQNKKLLLKEVPCGDKYPQCKFICDAHKASSEMIDLKKKIDFLNNNHKEVESEIVSLDPEKIEDHIKKYDQVINKRTQLESEIEKKEVLREKTELQNKSVEKEIDTLLSLSKQYEENRELIENKESFIKELEKIKDDLSLKERDLKDCQDSLMEYYKEHGSLEQKLNSLKEQKEELENLRKDFSAYDLFMTCMHSNGISYDIIKKKLPVINNEIAKVLANVVNFEVFFENDSRHLKILIKHPSHEPRPIEMGSGAEKTIAAMAIRLALLSVSNLPKSDLFILDEPGTALDADNMDGFVRILELVKSYFKTVLLISHLDSLKDCVDMQITIDKAGHYAKVVEA
jgi:DNA repair exonuclease SbcCD ATPase subunit